MQSIEPEFALPMLRRQLEEILSMVKADPDVLAASSRSVDEVPRSSVGPPDATVAEPEAIDDDRPEPTDCELASSESDPQDQRDHLYDDALVVLTEFGQASPAILQMWLSIDYGRAITILNRFKSEGLISSKGRVRHKAFSLRRALEPQA